MPRYHRHWGQQIGDWTAQSKKADRESSHFCAIKGSMGKVGYGVSLWKQWNFVKCWSFVFANWLSLDAFRSCGRRNTIPAFKCFSEIHLG